MPRIGEVRADLRVLALHLRACRPHGPGDRPGAGVAASRPAVQSALKDVRPRHDRGTRAAPAARQRCRGRSRRSPSSSRSAPACCCAVSSRSWRSIPGSSADHLLTLQIALPTNYRTPDQQRALYASLFGGSRRSPVSSRPAAQHGCRWQHERHRPRSTSTAHPARRRSGRKSSSAAPCTTTSRRWASRSCADAASRARTARTHRRSPSINERWRSGSCRAKIRSAGAIRFGSADGAMRSTIVGVIGDVRHSGLEAEPAPEIYTLSAGAAGQPVHRASARRASDAARSRRRCAREVQAVDKNIAAYDIRPMTQVAPTSLAQRRFVLLLVGRLRRAGAGRWRRSASTA